MIRLPPQLLWPGRVMVFSDFDGTLVPLYRHPSQAELAPERRASLAEIARTMPLVIVSGRSLADLRERVGVAGLGYIGNHGLEMEFGDWHWIHPGIQGHLEALDRLSDEASMLIRGFPGVWLENKGLTASIHFRMAACGDKADVRELIDQAVSRYGEWFQLRNGKMVLEIRPRLDWDKGKAVRQMMVWLGRTPETAVVCLGDDETDEDVFRELAADRLAFTFVVGERADSAAGRRLSGVNEVWDLLQKLYRDHSSKPEQLNV